MPSGVKKPGFTIICAYNDEGKLQKLLLASVARQQDAAYELMLIDNRDNAHPAAAPALNQAARKARFDLIMFVHQDVSLQGASWLADSRKWIAELADLGAAGVAGSGERGMVASVLDGVPPRSAGPSSPLPQQVQTLDGCVLIVPASVFAGQGFDEATLRGWHLLGVDYCLDLLRRGLKSYVLPQWIYHESRGPADASAYAGTRDRILAKHRGAVDTVHATVGVWKTAAAS